MQSSAESQDTFHGISASSPDMDLIVQVLPFHISARRFKLLSLPNAQQSLAETQDTVFSP